MRPYGQKRIYGKGLRTWRRLGKIHIWMPTKNRKRGRRWNLMNHLTAFS